jgi:hypothetical protein
VKIWIIALTEQEIQKSMLGDVAVSPGKKLTTLWGEVKSVSLYHQYELFFKTRR